MERERGTVTWEFSQLVFFVVVAFDYSDTGDGFLHYTLKEKNGDFMLLFGRNGIWYRI